MLKGYTGHESLIKVGVRGNEGPGAPWATELCTMPTPGSWLLAPGLLLAWVVRAQVLTAMSAGFFLVSGTLRFLHLYCEPGYMVLFYLAFPCICS